MYTPQQENSKVNRQKKSSQLQGSNKASLEPKAKRQKIQKTQGKAGGKNRDHGGKGGGNNPQNRKSNSDKLQEMIRVNARKHKKQDFFSLFFFSPKLGQIGDHKISSLTQKQTAQIPQKYIFKKTKTLQGFLAKTFPDIILSFFTQNTCGRPPRARTRGGEDDQLAVRCPRSNDPLED
jgi:hypothetical protein